MMPHIVNSQIFSALGVIHKDICTEREEYGPMRTKVNKGEGGFSKCKRPQRVAVYLMTKIVIKIQAE